MVSKDNLHNKTVGLKSLKVMPVKTNGDGKVVAFVAIYGKVGIGDRLSKGLMEVNELWDQQSWRRPKNYWVVGDLLEDDKAVGVSCFVAEEYLREMSDKDKADWRNQAVTWVKGRQ